MEMDGPEGSNGLGKRTGDEVQPFFEPHQPEKEKPAVSTNKPIKVAILDDYQGVALEMADWSALEGRAEITRFRDHISDPVALVERLKPFDVLCVMRERTPLPGSILEQLPNLKLIASTSSRNASIDLASASARGITVCGTGATARGGNGAAELTWALILGIIRHLPAELASVHGGGWQVSIGGDLKGQTIGILGLGHIGGMTAKVAHAFGMNVIAWSPNLTPERAEEHGARLVGKEELFRDADIVTIQMVLSSRTRGIVGEPELRLMKRTAYLVNTSRGPLVDENALIEALRNRTIAGAALDVYAIEPLPESHPFRSLDNVLATPHVGFVTEGTYQTFFSHTVENISAWLNGTPIRVIH
jgi:phosphoglycerate dehydrogenase-like enzyme